METTPPRARPVALLLLLVLPLSACAEEREYPAGRQCASWKQDIGPLLAERCVECHGGAEPAGSYGLERYLSAIGGGSDDTPNAISGDDSSLLLTKIAPGSADEVHAPFTDLHPALRDWVVECELNYPELPIHEPGILNPRSDDFHGQLLRETRYDFGRCAECHGEDFGGGTSGVACTTCHEDGPTGCTTCHSELPELGAHAAHIPSPPTFGDECSTCHTVPAAWDATGHIFLADGTLDPPPAEVTLGGKAAAESGLDMREGPPAYDYEAHTCDNVYCHGDTYPDPAAQVPMPNWLGVEQAFCGSCHGLPPETATHPPSDQCFLCHGEVVDADLTIVAPELHIDAMVQLGSQDCAGGCHGSADSPAPPPDLRGNTSPTEVTVGAHQQHLNASFFSGPIECGACHLVPASVDAPGHIDGEPFAEVFPAAIADTSLAFGPPGGAADRRTTPVWDRESETCASVYCHGGAPNLAGDAAAAEQTPTWTAPFEGAVFCGSCHGIPPEDHTGVRATEPCQTCHMTTVTATFELTAEHMDGEVDF